MKVSHHARFRSSCLFDLYLEPLSAASCEPVPRLHGSAADELRLVADDRVQLFALVHVREQIEAVTALVSPVDILIRDFDDPRILIPQRLGDPCGNLTAFRDRRAVRLCGRVAGLLAR